MPFNPKDVAEAETECYNCAYELAPLNGATFRCYLGQMLFCGKRFLKAAAENYHKVFCGKFFDDIYVAKGREGRDICFLLRLLAYWVRSGDHPLKIPLISWMTPPSLGRPRPFTLDRVVIEPIRILQGLEADIFDAKYDHWVLQTVRNLVDKNAAGSWDYDALCGSYNLNEMYLFFNHSCEPNATRADSNGL